MTYKYPPCTYRVSVKAVILIGDKLLLVKENSTEWDLPGGGVEHKEQLEDALSREVKEETNLGISKIDTNLVQPWITYDEEANRPLLFLVYTAKTNQTTLNQLYNDVEIGLFTKKDFIALSLVEYIEQDRKSVV